MPVRARDREAGWLVHGHAGGLNKNGAFHSFVYNGPVFRKAIAYAKGEVVSMENPFPYCDLLLV